MDTAQQSLVILSLSKDLGTAVEENCQRLFYSPAKILRLRTPCSAQNDKIGQLLTPNCTEPSVFPLVHHDNGGSFYAHLHPASA